MYHRHKMRRTFAVRHQNVSYRPLVTMRNIPIYPFTFVLLDGRPIFGATQHNTDKLGLVDIRRVQTKQVVHEIRR